MNIEIQNRADTIEVVYIWSSLLQLTVKTRELTETEKNCFSWMLNQVIYLKLKKIMLLQDEQIDKITILFSDDVNFFHLGTFWFKTIVIFEFAQIGTALFFFSI